MREILKNGLNELSISYTEDHLDKIDMFYDMLVEKNKHMNLTRITDQKEFYVKHVLDSLSVNRIIEISDQYILDLGTGAGFPGIPLKIFFPDTKMLLMDSVNKKLIFINDVIDKLSLDNISTIHGRAEDLGHDKRYREKFDMVLSRAVADLSVLAEYSLPFVRIGGSFIAYKSIDCNEEIDRSKHAVKILSGSSMMIHEVDIPESDICRKMVIVKKKNSISRDYPRKAGIPSKNPL